MSYSQITWAERYAIAALLAHGYNQAHIAYVLDRQRSTISRELRRNVSRTCGWYRPKLAEDYARTRRRRTRQHSQYTTAQWRQVVRLLEAWLSPEQIAGLLREMGCFAICHETIYQYIKKDRRQGGQLYLNLRQGHRRRRKRYERRTAWPRQDRKRSILDRPPSVEARREIGHWEMDTMRGSFPSEPWLLTLVERATGYLRLGLLRARTVEEVNARASALLHAQPHPVRSITVDNGSEFQGHLTLEEALGTKLYFAQPYHAWERGTNENTNGLIRQYLPKGQSFATLTQYDCSAIARALNTRPRKRYNYATPEQRYVPAA